MAHTVEHALGQMELKLTSSNLSENTISNTWQLRKIRITKPNGTYSYPQGGQFLTLVITLKNSQGIVQNYKGFEFRFPPHKFNGQQSTFPQPPSTENTVIQFNKENYPNGVIELTGQLYQWEPNPDYTFLGTTAFKGSAWSYPITTTLNFETKTETEPIIEQISSILESFQILPEVYADPMEVSTAEEEFKTKWYMVTSPSGKIEEKKVSQKFIDTMTARGWKFELIEEPKPKPEPTETWWVTKPSGIIEQMTVTQKFIDTMTAQGWIFSKEKPTITQPENEDISVIFFVGTGGDLKTHFKFSSLIVAKDIQQELAKWISKNYGTTILTTFNNYTDNSITHNLEDIKNLIKQKIQDDEPDEPDPPLPPEPPEPNANMVRQEIGRFQVVNKTLKGKITYIATDSFNEHFYYNFENNSGYILKCYVIATDNEGNVLLSKQNDLRFSETERDETITISDYVDTEENKITVEFYVTNTPTQDSFEDDFAFVRTITTPYFPKKPDTLFGALYGLIAIPTALTLLGRKT